MRDKIAVHGIDSNWLEEHNIHRFSHKAMATVFDILIYHDNYSYALQAATESFAQLDLLEQDLSRFVENSDISRINQLNQVQLILWQETILYFVLVFYPYIPQQLNFSIRK